jgi:amino acid transporter
MSLRDVLFGKPLRTEEEQREQIGVASGIPTLGLDALASAAYGPEAALTVLLPLGILASAYIGPITSLILVVLFAVSVSYRQTIPAYPQGGGSFTVAKENLGPVPGLIAASALSIDYVLNVAVAISAGVGALVSTLPFLLPHTLALCLIILTLLTIVNLRGIRTAGLVFMFPTYLFVACLGATVLWGVGKTVLAHGHPVPVVPPPRIPPVTTMAAAWLLLRAFASGSTALTGIEAVSNAVPVFRPPQVILARRTLTCITAILAFLLAGVGFLSSSYHISATPPGQTGYQSVLSQLIGAVTGRGAFYFVSMASILFVLSLSANTSFADFPRVCRLLALDQYLPAQFAHRGSRLVYTSGIITLTACSAGLLIAFRGITDRLIPLFAIGAFLAFTLSQLGMVVHWRRTDGPHARFSLILNGLGALATATTLVIIAIFKFTEGAWISILLIPALVVMFLRIRRYHEHIMEEIRDDRPLEVADLPVPLIVIPLQRLDRVACKALQLALTWSPEIHVVQMLVEDLESEDLTDRWGRLVEQPARQAGYSPPKLVILPSPYREYFGPLLDYRHTLAAEHPGRPIVVMIPELVQKRWYHFLFPHRTTLLKSLLLLKGGPQNVIVTTPWYPPETRGSEAPAQTPQP